MRCGCLSAENCAEDIWCPVLGGRKENACWRAPCPVCHSHRALEYDAGRAVRWNKHCDCDRDIVRKALAALLGDHAAGRGALRPVEPREIKALLRAPVGATAQQVALLVACGMGTEEAMEWLGVHRTSRYRVRREVATVLRRPGRFIRPPPAG
jgi:hypothetical protein